MILKKWQYYPLLLMVFVLLFSLAGKNGVAAAFIFPPAPTININQTNGKEARPLITGLTRKDTDVLIYIDGTYQGLAHINEANGNVNNFYFQPVSPLTDGEHNIFAIARDRTSVVLSPRSEVRTIIVKSLPAPTLIAPNKKTVTAKVKPLIIGLTRSETFVHIFIDGVYNGKTKILTDVSGTANFVYTPFLNLSRGWHQVWAIAEDKEGRKSERSNILNFQIENPLPAPVLFSPVVNSQTNFHQPFIVGVAKNNVTVRVFIDHKLNGEFKVKNNPSGTANFSYRPFLPLTDGLHLIYATAVDSRGKESVWSNIIYFQIVSARQSTINKEVVAKARPEEGNIKVKGAEVKYESLPKEQTTEEKSIEIKKNTEVTATKEENAISEDKTLKEILEATTTEEKSVKGLLNETKERQSKLRLNLIIFILFLVAVIGWILWINRELIKEKQKENNLKDDSGKASNQKDKK